MAERVERKRAFHYAWLILISCCALTGAALGIIINCKGLFISSVCGELGCSVSAFTLYTTFYGLSAALTLTVVDKVYARCPIRLVLMVSLVVLCGATAAMGAFHSLPAWYAAGVAQGVSGAFLIYVPAPMLIHNWFVRHRGLALGISGIASGLLGAVMNPVLSAVIDAWGWRTAYVVQGASAFLLAAPFAAFVVVREPKDRGLAAYGADIVTSAAGWERSAAEQMEQGHGNRRRFWLCMLFAGIVTFCASCSQHYANYAVSEGYAASVGAMMVSVTMAGNILAKVFLGGGCDRWGGRKMCLVSTGLVAVGFLMLAVGRTGVAGLTAGALLTGVDQAGMTVMVPQAVAVIAPNERYDHVLSQATMSTMLTSSFSMAVIGLFYDLFGSYREVFFLGAFLQAAAMVICLDLFPKTPPPRKRR